MEFGFLKVRHCENLTDLRDPLRQDFGELYLDVCNCRVAGYAQAAMLYCVPDEAGVQLGKKKEECWVRTSFVE